MNPLDEKIEWKQTARSNQRDELLSGNQKTDRIDKSKKSEQNEPSDLIGRRITPDVGSLCSCFHQFTILLQMQLRIQKLG